MAGCNLRKATKAWIHKITPPEDDIFARDLITKLQDEDYDFIIQNFDKAALGNTPHTTLQKLYKYIDHDRLKSIELVGCSKILSMSGKRRTNLTYQLEFPNSWYTSNITIITQGNVRKTIGFRLNKIPNSLEEINKFTLKDKTYFHYLILINAIGIPIFVFYSLVLCLKTKIKRKWFWIPFILIGIGALNLNWTTGQKGIELISFRIPGAGIVKYGVYSPWILSVSFPLGAFLFLNKRKKLQASMMQSTIGEKSTDKHPNSENEKACSTNAHFYF